LVLDENTVALLEQVAAFLSSIAAKTICNNQVIFLQPTRLILKRWNALSSTRCQKDAALPPDIFARSANHVASP
jgi:hypothetical protein